MNTNVNEMISLIQSEVSDELKEIYHIEKDVKFLSMLLNYIYQKKNESFIFMIGEWDCIFRVYKENKGQEQYLDFLRFFKKSAIYRFSIYDWNSSNQKIMNS